MGFNVSTFPPVRTKHSENSHKLLIYHHLYVIGKHIVLAVLQMIFYTLMIFFVRFFQFCAGFQAQTVLPMVSTSTRNHGKGVHRTARYWELCASSSADCTVLGMCLSLRPARTARNRTIPTFRGNIAAVIFERVPLLLLLSVWWNVHSKTIMTPRVLHIFKPIQARCMWLAKSYVSGNRTFSRGHWIYCDYI